MYPFGAHYAYGAVHPQAYVFLANFFKMAKEMLICERNNKVLGKSAIKNGGIFQQAVPSSWDQIVLNMYQVILKAKSADNWE